MRLIVIILFACLCQLSVARGSKPADVMPAGITIEADTAKPIAKPRRNYYRLNGKLDDRPRHIEGMLVGVGDSTVKIATNWKTGDWRRKKATVREVPIGSIKSLAFRRSESLAKGLILGLFGGMTAGALLGYTTAGSGCIDNPNCIFGSPSGRAFIGGTMGLVLGLTTGAIIGARKKRYRLHGRMDLYRAHREELKWYVE
jgi:hypothetical protein